MRNIIVENYLRIDRDLVGKSISLTKPNEILFFLEVCRIKQMEVLAKTNVYCNDFECDLIVKKKSLIGIINKSILRDNRELVKFESDGVKFGNNTIIESIIFDKVNGEFIVEFDEYNFMKHFIYLDDNFIKVPVSMFTDLKSKNAFMLLLWILKFQNLNGYRFISQTELCSVLGKDIAYLRKDNLKRDLNKILEQLFKLEILTDDKTIIDKNGNFNIPVIPFSVNIKEINTKKSKCKNKNIIYDVTDEEIRLYADK